MDDSACVELLRATLHYAVERTSYYRQAFAGLSLDIDSLADLRSLPLLTREIFASRCTDLLVDGVAPEYVGLTSGTTFAHTGQHPMLHYQTESEHRAWVSLYASQGEGNHTDRPLMLRLIDPDRGVEVAGAFPGCFSLPLENPYHFQLILSLLGKEWSFPGFGKNITSLSGPLELLQLLTLLCRERGVDSRDFQVGLVTSSGWQLTSRWRALIENYWGAEIQELYGLSEAPGMFAARCRVCARYHWSPLSVIEVLRLNGDEPVTAGVGRVVVTCLLPIASAQPIIRYDTQDVIEIVDGCGDRRPGFEYIGRLSDLVLIEGTNGSLPLLSRLTVTEVLDSVPDVAYHENTRARQFGLRAGFGWPRYALRDTTDQYGRHVEVAIELRWSPVHYPSAAQELRATLRQRLLHASPALEIAVKRGQVLLDVHVAEPGGLVPDRSRP